MLDYAARHEATGAAVADAIPAAKDRTRETYESGLVVVREIDTHLKYLRSQRGAQRSARRSLRLV